MKSIKEWRAMNETTTAAVTNTQQNDEPDENDWDFYRSRIQGRAKRYLSWLVDEVSQKNLTLAKKGFILQEVMDALGMNISEVVRVITNIKRSMAKKQLQQPMQQNPQQMPPPQQQPQNPQQAQMAQQANANYQLEQ
jgi:hypothetical protein